MGCIKPNWKLKIVTILVSKPLPKGAKVKLYEIKAVANYLKRFNFIKRASGLQITLLS